MTPSVPNPRRPANLALSFQEPFTAVVRLRTDRQSVSDAAAFRSHMRDALKTAAEDAERKGYAHEDVKLAVFAVVAFLDETILNMSSAAFSDWPRKPLQEELFGVHVAGEIFFKNIERILVRGDSHDVADLLEVYELALLLGFAGRYTIGGKGELNSLKSSLHAKIRRIRGESAPLSPSWAPQRELSTVGTDPLVRKLTLGAIICAVLAVALFITFKLTLSSAASDLQPIATQAHIQESR